MCHGLMNKSFNTFFTFPFIFHIQYNSHTHSSPPTFPSVIIIEGFHYFQPPPLHAHLSLHSLPLSKLIRCSLTLPLSPNSSLALDTIPCTLYLSPTSFLACSPFLVLFTSLQPPSLRAHPSVHSLSLSKYP